MEDVRHMTDDLEKSFFGEDRVGAFLTAFFVE